MGNFDPILPLSLDDPVSQPQANIPSMQGIPKRRWDYFPPEPLIGVHKVSLRDLGPRGRTT